MKELKNFEEELYKCSRCGLCQSVCPVYKASLNECAVSKGKFNMLNGVLKGELSVTKQMKKYLDMCTGCNACKSFCPSSIDAREIIQCAKEEYYRNSNQTCFAKLFGSYSFLKILLKLLKPCFMLYRLLHIKFLVKLCRSIFLNCGEIGKKILLLNFLADSEKITKQKRNSAPKKKTLVFFDGCINKYVNPQTEKAVFSLLSQAGYKIKKKNFECCGVTFYSDGNIKEFKKIINKNLKQLEKNFDYVLTDCASCADVLKHYKDYTKNPIAEKLNKNTINILELINSLNFKTKKKMNVSIHIPCHEEFDLESFVKKIKGIEYKEVQSQDKCCGFAGSFAIKNANISREISKQKAKDYIHANTDIVLTTCPSCMLGLEQGFIDEESPYNSRPRVMNLFVFLAKYCETY